MALRPHLIDITVAAFEGRLEVRWTFSTNRHHRETVAALAESYMNRVRALVAHCLAPDAAGHTPSDFPLAALDQRSLDSIVAMFEGIGG